MREKKVIYSKQFDHWEYDESEDDENLSEDTKKGKSIIAGDENIVDFIERNLEYVPNNARIAQKDLFISKVIELSETYHIDAEIDECEGYYMADIYLSVASYSGYIKILITNLFMLCDEFSFFKSSDNKFDVIVSFLFHTHDVYFKKKKITELEQMY